MWAGVDQFRSCSYWKVYPLSGTRQDIKAILGWISHWPRQCATSRFVIFYKKNNRWAKIYQHESLFAAAQTVHTNPIHSWQPIFIALESRCAGDASCLEGDPSLQIGNCPKLRLAVNKLVSTKLNTTPYTSCGSAEDFQISTHKITLTRQTHFDTITVAGSQHGTLASKFLEKMSKCRRMNC